MTCDESREEEEEEEGCIVSMFLVQGYLDRAISIVKSATL